MRRLLFLLLLLPMAAFAQSVNVNSSMSTATIQSDITACGAGCTVNFAAGSGGGYNFGGAQVALQCNDTLLGPVAAPGPNSSSPVTAFISDNEGTYAFADPGQCTGTTTIKYMGFTGSGTFVYLWENAGTIDYEYNDCSGNNPPAPGGGPDVCLNLDGDGTTGGGISFHNLTYEHSWFHDACSSLDAAGYDSNGLCDALLISYGNNSTGSATIEYNWVGTGSAAGGSVQEGFKSLQNGNYPINNFTVRYNDFQLLNRLGIEFQNMNPVNVLVDSNSFQNWYSPNNGTGAISVPMWYPTTAPSGQVVVTDNVITNGTQTASPYWFYAVEEGGPGAIAKNNVVQGTWQNGLTCYESVNMIDTGNTVQGSTMSANSSFFLDEQAPTYPCTNWTTTPNTTGATPAAITSTAPVISPGSTTCSAAVTVTLSDSGTNHSIFYTTNGTTPTISSTLYTGAFSVACGSTVKAIGQWGTGANALTWPANQGYTPSAVVSATYTSGTTPTLSGITLATTGGITQLPAGKTNQIIATCDYTSPTTTTNCTTTDAYGNVAGTWTSSNTAAATISTGGLVTGVAAGSTNITAKVSTFTSPNLPLTIIPGPPSLTSVYLNPTNNSNANTLYQYQTLQFSAYCVYSNGQTILCSNPGNDPYGDVVSAWSSTNTAVMTVGAFGTAASGIVTAVAAGTANVQAVVNGTLYSNYWGITVSAATAVTACGTLSGAGPYVLINNVSSAGTCFTMTGASPTFVVNGFEIDYGTGNNITSNTATAIVHGTGCSVLDNFPSPVGNTPGDPLPEMVAVTRLANTSGGANAYTFNTDYNLNVTHGFPQRNGVLWLGTANCPANGATYYADWTYNTPVFGFTSSATGTLLALKGPGRIVEANGSIGYGYAVTGAINSINGLTCVLHGVSAACLGKYYGANGFPIQNSDNGSSTQDNYYRDFFLGAINLQQEPNTGSATTLVPVSGNYVDSFEQNAYAFTYNYMWVNNNTIHGTANASNDFAVEDYGSNWLIESNNINCINAPGSCRGIDVAGKSTEVRYNTVDTGELANNPEYGGCQLGGADSVRIFDAGVGTNSPIPLSGLNIHDNVFHSYAQKNGTACASTAFVSRSYGAYGDTPSPANIVTRNTFTSTCATGCTGFNTPIEGSPLNSSNCWTILNYSHLTITDSTFNCEEAVVWMDNEGGTTDKIQDSTITALNTAQSPFVFINAWPSTDSGLPSGTQTDVEFQDDTFTNFDPTTIAVAVNTTGINFYFLIENTYTVSVGNAAGAALAGVTVTYTDGLGTVQATGTTDTAGNFSAVVPEFKSSWNTSSVNTKTNYTTAGAPYTISLSKTGCTTQTYTVNINAAHLSATKLMAGC